MWDIRLGQKVAQLHDDDDDDDDNDDDDDDHFSPKAEKNMCYGLLTIETVYSDTSANEWRC